MRKKLSVFGVGVQDLSPTVSDRFWEKVVKGDACWSWDGAHDAAGYGLIIGGGIIRGPMRAHQLSWIIHFGIIPEGQWVLHHCDNPECSNPEHLWLGNHKDNMRDKAKKNRGTSGNQKLYARDARIIQEMYSSGQYSHEELAHLFGCSGATICLITNGNLKYAT